jgi:hypothetical protein
MKQILYISIIATIILFSCDENNGTDDLTKYSGILVSSTIDVYFKDSLGNDLLDTLNENHYDSSDLKLFNLIDGQMVEFRKNEMDGTIKTGILFYHRDDINSYCVLLNELNGSKFDEVVEGTKTTFKSISYLQLNEHDMDTIKLEEEHIILPDRGLTSSVITKVWYNNELKWEEIPDSSNTRLIKVLK